MRVLLVEDELRIAETLRRGLAVEGFVVDVDHNGVNGLRSARTAGYDLVVLDVMLPGMSGYDVCREMREAGVWTPVLMLTAKDGEYDQVDAFELGADDYLTKPFSFAVLVARMRALLRRGAPVRPTILSAGDLTLDPATRMVTRQGRSVALTPREFSLLQFLLRHRGDVVTKADILASVWDTSHVGDDNVVEVYVGYLRRKIDTPFDRRAIQTVRGVGYRLDADGG